MRNTTPRKLQVYRDQNGRQPFTEWFYANSGYKKLEREFANDWTGLKMGILATANLLVPVYLSDFSTLVQAIASIMRSAIT